MDVSSYLSDCAREPIHIPGAIQPHGVLLGARFEPGLRIALASMNTAPLLGMPHEALLGMSLLDVIDPSSRDALARACFGRSQWIVNSLPLAIAGRAFDGVLHRAGGLLVVELEPRREPEPPEPPGLPGLPGLHDDGPAGIHRALHAAVARVLDIPSMTELFAAVAEEVRRLTGFDRVMVYRFDEADDGEVVGEALRDDLEPLLGQRYPASDIPAQARRLYLQNRLRLIADARYAPVPILPAGNPVDGGPLDLSHAVLRSVSPVHLEYLTNMGVRASMSISLVDEGRLWGLVACHHATPHYVRYDVRSACEMFGDIASSAIASRARAEVHAERRASDQALVRLIDRISGLSVGGDLARGLLADGTTVLDLVEAGGAVVATDGRQHHLGRTPPNDFVEALIAHVGGAMREGVYATDHLAAELPAAAAHTDVASGVLAIGLPDIAEGCVLWLRPEVVRTLDWGGDPHHPVEPSTDGKIGPRRSFALWRESVRQRSRPFRPWEREIAAHLRHVTMGVVLRKAADFARLNQALREALRSRDDFLSMASHELKTPVATLQLQLDSLDRAARRGQVTTERIFHGVAIAQRQVNRLETLINNLLDVSRISSGHLLLDLDEFDLAAVAGAVVPRFTDAGALITLKCDVGAVGRWDRFRLDQVLTNLVSNAIKYGGGAPIEVEVRSDPRDVRLVVRDHGPGVPPELRPRLFERFARATHLRHGGGFGLGLWITREIIAEHGGRIECEPTPGGGATFVVTLPREGPPRGAPDGTDATG